MQPVTAVEPKPSPLETEKKPAASATRPPGLQAAERTSTEENHVLGFGIVLESPSSDVSWYVLAANLVDRSFRNLVVLRLFPPN